MRTRYITNTLHLESSTALYNPGLCRSPQIIGFIVVGFQVSFMTGIGAIFTALGPALLQIGLSIGLSLVSSLLAPKAPKPEDVQGNIRQSIPPRVRLYGRGLLGGAWAFGATKAGSFHKVLAVHSGKLSEINAFWVDDRIVTPNAETGLVASAPFSNRLRIEYRMGLATETYYDTLEDDFPEWTASHRGDGVASLYAKQFAIDPEDVPKVFPNLYNTLYRVDANGVAVWDPSDAGQDIDDPETWTWSDNLVRVVADYLWSSDGMRMPRSMLTTPLALAGLAQSVADCADAIPLKAGGTEPRYRAWVPYLLNERPADVLRRMMDAGNARLKPTPDGGIYPEVGKWRAPEVTLDDDCIVSFDGVGRGKDILQTANTITATFISADHKFQSTDADPWVDDADVSERGEIVTDVNAICSPSHGQTRRLMKIAAHRANPAWVGSFVLNKRGLKAFGERFVNLDYTLLGISGTFEVMEFKFVFGEHSTIVGATVALQSMSSTAFDWNASTEEGTAPPNDEVSEDTDFPDVSGFTATLVAKTVGGVPLPYARLEWDAPENEGLFVDVRAKKVSDTAWTTIVSRAGATTTTIDWLLSEEGETYEFEASYNSFATRGEWVDSTPPTLTAVTDTTPPVALSGFSVTGGSVQMGHAPLAFVTSADDHLSRIALYRAPHGVALDKDAHFVRRLYGVPKPSTFAYVDGDSTRTNLLSNGDFASDTIWTKGAGFTISGGKAHAAAGSASNLSQPYAFAAGSVFRNSFLLSAVTGGNISGRFFGGTTATPIAMTGTNGRKFGFATAITGNVTYALNKDASFAGDIDEAYLYLETAACAPQGDWDYYAIPENVSGIEGPQSGPLNIIIV